MKAWNSYRHKIKTSVRCFPKQVLVKTCLRLAEGHSHKNKETLHLSNTAKQEHTGTKS